MSLIAFLLWLIAAYLGTAALAVALVRTTPRSCGRKDSSAFMIAAASVSDRDLKMHRAPVVDHENCRFVDRDVQCGSASWLRSIVPNQPAESDALIRLVRHSLSTLKSVTTPCPHRFSGLSSPSARGETRHDASAPSA